jgi:hypothetical protein
MGETHDGRSTPIPGSPYQLQLASTWQKRDSGFPLFCRAGGRPQHP